MNKPLTAPLDPALADRLLDLLSTDDLYRERFRRDPRAALEEVGYTSPGPAQMTACGATLAQPEALIDCRVEDLAPKEAIAQARESIKAMLTKGLSQTSPQLDTAIASRRLRT